MTDLKSQHFYVGPQRLHAEAPLVHVVVRKASMHRTTFDPRCILHVSDKTYNVPAWTEQMDPRILRRVSRFTRKTRAFVKRRRENL